MHQKSISFASCILQTFLYLAFAVTECLILVVMSYDRFVVICHPLKYTLIMSWRVFVILAATCWVFSFLLASLHTKLILRLPFCGPQNVNHFFLSNHVSIQISLCRHKTQSSRSFCRLCDGLTGASVLAVSFLYMNPGGHPGDPLEGGPQKLHLCVVGLFFGCAISMYMVP